MHRHQVRINLTVLSEKTAQRKNSRDLGKDIASWLSETMKTTWFRRSVSEELPHANHSEKILACQNHHHTYVFTEGHLPNLALQVDASHKWVHYRGIKTVSPDESLYTGTTIDLKTYKRQHLMWTILINFNAKATHTQHQGHGLMMMMMMMMMMKMCVPRN